MCFENRSLSRVKKKNGIIPFFATSLVSYGSAEKSVHCFGPFQKLQLFTISRGSVLLTLVIAWLLVWCMRLTFVVLSEMSPWVSSDESPMILWQLVFTSPPNGSVWYFVQTLMVPRGWILLTDFSSRANMWLIVKVLVQCSEIIKGEICLMDTEAKFVSCFRSKFWQQTTDMFTFACIICTNYAKCVIVQSTCFWPDFDIRL